ncbi:trypsin-like peptidase domain-containing protein, partial [Candidatus Micrarchaeota archaeon]|nr:trypsin-like peptidase domain-containing protein [Candidatus Micrarchaeota archaeon]
MKKILLFILILMLVSGAFAYTLQWPEKEPNIIQKTKQIYEPGIMVIGTTITGTISYPDFEMVFQGQANNTGNTGNAGNTGNTGNNAGNESQLIVGTWSSAANSNKGNYTAEITFKSNGIFSGWENYPEVGEYYVYSGSFTVTGSTLSMDYGSLSLNGVVQNPMSLDFGISFPNNNTMNITANGGTVTYIRTGTQLSEIQEEKKLMLQDEEAVVQVIESMEFVPLQGIEAKQVDETVETGMSGTGFVINPDGYIMTNAHVVFVSDQEATYKLYNTAFQEIQSGIYSEIASRYNLTEEQKQRVIKAISEKFIAYILQYGQLSNVKVDNYAMPGVLLPGQVFSNVAWPADLKAKGQVLDEKAETLSWGKDVAIIKVNQKNLPAVKLGDSDQLSTGEQIFVIGYPGTGLDVIFDNTQTIEPTVTSGIVSARKMMTNNVEVIQTDAAINHGNSGGPVFNDKGEVIGIATFGSDQVQNISFIMPINLAKEFMNEINVKNEQGLTGQKFQEGVEAYFRKDCTATENAMKEVLTLRPGMYYAQNYISACQEARIKGLYSDDFLGQAWLFIVIAVLVTGAYYLIKVKKITIT